ncbi:chalcone-flavanone isomerase family protein [Wolffia australiana]
MLVGAALVSTAAPCAGSLVISSTCNGRMNCLGNLNCRSAAVNSISSPLLGHLSRSTSRFVRVNWARLLPRASVKSVEFTEEPATNVKFLKGIQVPGCSSPLSLVGAGYREKVFAIIGVKVYAAGFYADPSIADALQSWKGQPATKILENSTLFLALYEDSREKSLQIALVRDVDGQTFWNALNDVISPRIKEPTAADGEALEIFRKTFQSRPLNKGTVVLLTWVEPSKLLVSISSEGIPSSVDATIESKSVAFALFEGFFGPTPVSPSLKASVANGIMILLDQ